MPKFSSILISKQALADTQKYLAGIGVNLDDGRLIEYVKDKFIGRDGGLHTEKIRQKAKFFSAKFNDKARWHLYFSQENRGVAIIFDFYEGHYQKTDRRTFKVKEYSAGELREQFIKIDLGQEKEIMTPAADVDLPTDKLFAKKAAPTVHFDVSQVEAIKILVRDGPSQSFYIDSLAGSGKTLVALRYLGELASGLADGRKLVYLTASDELATRQQEQFVEYYPELKDQVLFKSHDSFLSEESGLKVANYDDFLNFYDSLSDEEKLKLPTNLSFLYEEFCYWAGNFDHTIDQQDLPNQQPRQDQEDQEDYRQHLKNFKEYKTLDKISSTIPIKPKPAEVEKKTGNPKAVFYRDDAEIFFGKYKEYLVRIGKVDPSDIDIGLLQKDKYEGILYDEAQQLLRISDSWQLEKLSKIPVQYCGDRRQGSPLFNPKVHLRTQNRIYLQYSYRCSNNVSNFADQVLALERKIQGKQDHKKTFISKSDDEGSVEFSLYKPQPKDQPQSHIQNFPKDLLNKIELNSDQYCIIVPNQAIKGQLKAAGLEATILLAKNCGGFEYKNVVLYNCILPTLFDDSKTDAEICAKVGAARNLGVAVTRTMSSLTIIDVDTNRAARNFEENYKKSDAEKSRTEQVKKETTQTKIEIKTDAEFLLNKAINNIISSLQLRDKIKDEYQRQIGLAIENIYQAVGEKNAEESQKQKLQDSIENLLNNLLPELLANKELLKLIICGRNVAEVIANIKSYQEFLPKNAADNFDWEKMPSNLSFELNFQKANIFEFVLETKDPQVIGRFLEQQESIFKDKKAKEAKEEYLYFLQDESLDGAILKQLLGFFKPLESKNLKELFECFQDSPEKIKVIFDYTCSSIPADKGRLIATLKSCGILSSEFIVKALDENQRLRLFQIISGQGDPKIKSADMFSFITKYGEFIGSGEQWVKTLTTFKIALDTQKSSGIKAAIDNLRKVDESLKGRFDDNALKKILIAMLLPPKDKPLVMLKQMDFGEAKYQGRDDEILEIAQYFVGGLEQKNRADQVIIAFLLQDFLKENAQKLELKQLNEINKDLIRLGFGLDKEWLKTAFPEKPKEDQTATRILAGSEIELLDAAGSGNLAAVKKFLKQGVNIDHTDNNGCTALFIAIKNGHLDIVNVLLEKGADVNKTMNDDSNPLITASVKRYLGVVKRLLEKGADVNKAMGDDFTPLIMASNNGHLDIVNALLEGGANVNQAAKDGATSLYIAAQQGHLDVVKRLLEEGADVNQASNDGTTPLYIAVKAKHLDVIDALLKAGADVNQKTNDGFTPFSIAAREGHSGVINALLEKGANINQVTNSGATPLYIASKKGHLDVVRRLLEEGADVDRAPNDGTTPLYIAIQDKHPNVVNALLEKGANVNQPANNGATPLYLAVQDRHLDIVNALLEKGADANQAMNDDFTPLYLASSNGYLDIVNCLLEQGADVNKEMRDGATSIYIAAKNGNLDVINALIKKGANVNQPVNDGSTPLLIAVKSGHLEVVNALIAAGADVNKSINAGCNSLYIAIIGKHTEIIELLIKSGIDTTDSHLTSIKKLFDPEKFQELIIKVEEIRWLKSANKDKESPKYNFPNLFLGDRKISRNLENCTFQGAHLVGVDFRDSQFSETTFEGAHIDIKTISKTFGTQINFEKLKTNPLFKAFLSGHNCTVEQFDQELAKKDHQENPQQQPNPQTALANNSQSPQQSPSQRMKYLSIQKGQLQISDQKPQGEVVIAIKSGEKMVEHLQSLNQEQGRQQGQRRD
ncbi:MAG: ankyrin repeat domain-containing protein [Pseudomonadota bacterium]